MKAHQITYSQGVMTARRLSCFECAPSQQCDHFYLFEAFPQQTSAYSAIYGTSDSEEELIDVPNSMWVLDSMILNIV